MKNELQERGSDTTVADQSNDRVGEAEAVGRRQRLIDALILVLLGAFAVTQPILSDFRAGAGYFLARDAQPLEIVLLVLLLTFIPGVLANLFVWAADAFSDHARRITFEVFVGLFVALVAQTILARFVSLHWSVVMVGSLLIGALAVLAYRRTTWFRRFLTYLIPAPLIFVLLFLFTPPVSALVVPQQASDLQISVASETPVIFLVFDEFPVVSLLDSEGELDATRYPNFARLASVSTWYKYTAAAHDYTWWAIPALLTGQTPAESRVPTAADYPGNLFTLLEGSHDLHVHEPYTRLCSPDLCGDTRAPSTFAQRFVTMTRDSLRLYDLMLRPDPRRSDALADPFDEFGAGTLGPWEAAPFDPVGQFGEFVDEIKPGPILHFAHLMLPHAPYRYYASGAQYNSGDELTGHESETWVDPVLAELAHQRHLLQAQAMDGLVGDLLDRLESVDMLDEAILVVTADHGVSFQSERPIRAITPETAYEIGMVPLFIKSPNQVIGVVESDPARTVDVLPTVAAHLGLELPWEVAGQTLAEDGSDIALTVRAKGGDELALTHPEQGIRDAVARAQKVFGGDGESFDLYSIGEYDSVIGEATVLLPSTPSGLVGRVEEGWRFEHVAPELGFVPGFIHGSLMGEVDPEMHVAVALNGLVHTVVALFDVRDDRAEFSAILPEYGFHSGFNDLDLFVVSGPGNDPVVETVEHADHHRFQLQRGNQGQVVALSDSTGASWELVDDETIRGAVDEAFWEASDFSWSDLKDLHVAGWAVNEDTRKPADQIVVFVNGVFAGSASVDRERPDMQNAYQTVQTLFSGFRGSLSQFLPVASLDVRAYALSGGFAEELPITDEAQVDIAAG
jgi:hypothetical protein